jgi:beta-lactamase class D
MHGHLPAAFISRRGLLAASLLATSIVRMSETAAAQDIAERIERADLASVFSDRGTVGTMAVYEPAVRRLVLVNAKRADQRFVPASTFKLANSLIALETGVVKDENEIIPYGGKPQWNKAWERDMPMREALLLSNVQVYQEIARRVGLGRYSEWLAKLSYGNQQVGSVVDQFWLKGPLRTSAIEQALFAARLARKELPLSQRSQSIVREIARLETANGKGLFGKTGWAVGDEKIGWLTGLVEAGQDVTAFSLNIDMPDAALAPKRIEIAKHILVALGRY